MKVLIADDEAVSRRLLESSLRRWGYDVVVAADGYEASRLLQAPDAPKLVVLDWLMPGMDGAQLCQEIRKQKQEPYTYVLLLTGKSTQNDVIEGLEAGADDYITKPFDPQELKVRLRTGKRILHLQEQLICAREALRDMATRDSLTGLWNRGAVLDILDQELARAKRAESCVGIVMVDLDLFKRINDTYGHSIGDEVLRKAAQAMRSATRPYDAAGRYGGEEFLIVLPGCNETNTISHAERMRAALSRTTVATSLGPVAFTISAGVAVFDGNTPLDAAALIGAADVALYRAKSLGRDRVEAANCLQLA